MSVPIVTVLVKRGDELPKKNYETKLHPTYEVLCHVLIMVYAVMMFVCIYTYEDHDNFERRENREEYRSDA